VSDTEQAIPPALSESEWRPGVVQHLQPTSPVGAYTSVTLTYGPPSIMAALNREGQKLALVHQEYDKEGKDWEVRVDRPHALAALCLYGQPFGFTQEEAQAVRESAEDDHAAYEHYTTLRIVAAKIAAPLPPETS
jgi:hypothetical protein